MNCDEEVSAGGGFLGNVGQVAERSWGGIVSEDNRQGLEDGYGEGTVVCGGGAQT